METGKRWGNYLLLLVLFVLLISSVRAPQPRLRRTRELTPFMRSKIILINFTPREEKMILATIPALISLECSDAFIGANLPPPIEIILETGIIIRPDVDLRLNTAQDLGLIDDRTRIAYMNVFSSCQAQAGTVPAWRGEVQLTTDPRPRIFLFPTAFAGRSYLMGWQSLDTVIVHEMIHSAGQPPIADWFFLGRLRHDLARFPHYSRIMKACR